MALGVGELTLLFKHLRLAAGAARHGRLETSPDAGARTPVGALATEKTQEDTRRHDTDAPILLDRQEIRIAGPGSNVDPVMAIGAAIIRARLLAPRLSE